MQVFTDRDFDYDLIRSRRVVILGFGSQGHAHELKTASMKTASPA